MAHHKVGIFWDHLVASVCLPGVIIWSSITLVVDCSWSSSIMRLFVHTSKSKRTQQCCESGKDTAVLRAQRSYLSSGFTTPSVHTTERRQTWDKRCFEVQIVAHLQSRLYNDDNDGFVCTQTCMFIGVQVLFWGSLFLHPSRQKKITQCIAGQRLVFMLWIRIAEDG